MITVKDGIKLSKLRNEMLHALPIVDSIFMSYGYDTIITCFTGGHKEDDPHTHGYAIDFRTNHITNDYNKKQIAIKCQNSLGKIYYVQYEPDLWKTDPDTGIEKQVRWEHMHLQVKKNIWPTLK